MLSRKQGRANLEIDRKFDVVVVGGGNAALTAAITAAEEDRSKKVLLIERAPREFRGGNSKYTRSIRYVHDHDNYSSGPYNKNEYIADIEKATKGYTTKEILAMLFAIITFIPHPGEVTITPLSYKMDIIPSLSALLNTSIEFGVPS